MIFCSRLSWDVGLDYLKLYETVNSKFSGILLVWKLVPASGSLLNDLRQTAAFLLNNGSAISQGNCHVMYNLSLRSPKHVEIWLTEQCNWRTVSVREGNSVLLFLIIVRGALLLKKNKKGLLCSVHIIACVLDVPCPARKKKIARLVNVGATNTFKLIIEPFY